MGDKGFGLIEVLFSSLLAALIIMLTLSLHAKSLQLSHHNTAQLVAQNQSINLRELMMLKDKP